MSSSASTVGTASNVAAEAAGVAGNAAAATSGTTVQPTAPDNVSDATRTKPAKHGRPAQNDRQAAKAPLVQPEVDADGQVSGASSVSVDGESTTASGAADATAGGSASASSH